MYQCKLKRYRLTKGNRAIAHCCSVNYNWIYEVRYNLWPFLGALQLCSRYTFLVDFLNVNLNSYFCIIHLAPSFNHHHQNKLRLLSPHHILAFRFSLGVFIPLLTFTTLTRIVFIVVEFFVTPLSLYLYLQPWYL